VARIDGMGQVMAENSADITPAEFNDVWALVVRHRFQTFVPRQKPGQVFDAASKFIRIEWSKQKGSPVQSHEAQ
jgi:hypothetical protein